MKTHSIAAEGTSTILLFCFPAVPTDSITLNSAFLLQPGQAAKFEGLLFHSSSPFVTI